MWNWIHKMGSPKTCYRWAGYFLPWVALGLVIASTIGLWGALWLSPPDYQQGDVFRIIFIHVPSAILSLFIYVLLSGYAFIYLIWKIKIADVLFKISLPIGALFTLITLVTGSLWGRPTWGTYWIWDARLTSELILLFIYLGILGLRRAIPNAKTAAKASGILALIGLVDLPIIHYSVSWWNTLHQGATLLKFSMPSIAPSMLYPLLWMLAAFFFYYALYICMRLRTELLGLSQGTAWVKELGNRG